MWSMPSASGKQVRLPAEEEKPERRKRAPLDLKVTKAEEPAGKRAVARKAEPEPAVKPGKIVATPKKQPEPIEKSPTLGKLVDNIVDLALTQGRTSSFSPEKLTREALSHRHGGIPSKEQVLVQVKVDPRAAAAAVHLGLAFSDAAFAFGAHERGEIPGSSKGKIVKEMRWG